MLPRALPITLVLTLRSNVPRPFEHLSRAFWMAACLALAVVVGVLDYLTGSELSFSLFYLFPIALVTWFAGRASGIALALLSAALWMGAELVAESHYSSEAILYWNTGIRLGFFVVVTELLCMLRVNLRHQEQLAQTDPTTGAANRRAFLEQLEREVKRARRYGHPYALAYLDVDDFKQINDRYGHTVGDEVLWAVAETMKHSLRETDFYARLGGDEFALLLPETGEAAAGVVISKLHRELNERMRSKHWPVSFSIGALAVGSSADSVEDVIRAADELMYTAKQSGKNGVRYAAYSVTPRDAA